MKNKKSKISIPIIMNHQAIRKHFVLKFQPAFSVRDNLHLPDFINILLVTPFFISSIIIPRIKLLYL